MAKNATIWKPVGGQGDVTNENDGDYLKINSTDYLILTSGSTNRLLLGATVVVPKPATVWSDA